MHQQAGRLVDGDEVFITENNAEHQSVRLRTMSMLRCMRRVFDEGGGVLADQADPDMKALHRLALAVCRGCAAR